MASGELSLSNASKLQSFAYAERKQGREHEKSELVAQVVGKNARELTIVVSEELYRKLIELKGKAGHIAPGFAELIETMADESLAWIAKTEEGGQAAQRGAAPLRGAERKTPVRSSSGAPCADQESGLATGRS